VNTNEKTVSLTTLFVTATVTFIIGAILCGVIVRSAWSELADGWKEVALGYKSTLGTCEAMAFSDSIQQADKVEGIDYSNVLKAAESGNLRLPMADQSK
jgi:hypothetical protein